MIPESNFPALVWSVLILVGIFVGHWIVKGVLRFFQPQEFPSGFPKAGMVIGFLERALILAFFIINQPALIGFVLTIKAIYRFGDIQGENDEKFKISEYFIIGTLTSFLFTVLIYAIGRILTGGSLK